MRRARKLGDDGQLFDSDYKLIDFGSALGVDENLAKKDMMTWTANRDLGMGTPPYMSPEIYKEPGKASYPTDLWSLGVSMFEMVTAKLPFEAENDLLWNFAIAGNMDEKAPNVLDTLEEGKRATFDHNLACVIAKALEKRVASRCIVILVLFSDQSRNPN
jgi:serine/threonine protein kinase